MSWSASFRVVNGNIEDEQKVGVPSGDPLTADEVEGQYEHCKGHALDMIIHGDLGSHHNAFQVNLGGHANPRHERRPDWANDYIQIRVSQI